MEDLDFNNINLFDNKSLADVFKDIYKNTKKKDKIIDDLISDLKPLVKTVSDAMQLIPYIKDYLDVGVKNNEHLIKMAAVVQRSIQSSKGGQPGINNESDFIITQEERKQLLETVEESNKLIPTFDKSKIEKNDEFATENPPTI
jgi:hypothetical protein